MKQSKKMCLLVLSILTLILVGCKSTAQEQSSHRVSKGNEAKIIEQIRQLSQLNNEIMEDVEKMEKKRRYTSVRKSLLADYFIYDYKVPFTNIATPDSNGICEAISTFEKLNFLDQLDHISYDQKYLEKEGINLIPLKKETLSEYAASFQDIKQIDDLNVLQADSRKNESATVLFRRSTNYYKGNTENIKLTLKNQKLANLINVLNYLQDTLEKENKLFQFRVQQPEYYSDEKYSLKHVNTLNVARLTMQIDAGNPVLIRLANGEDIHTVLAYGYEDLSNNTENVYKVYVSDSNFPVMYKREDQTNEEEADIPKYNLDLATNVAIILRYNKDIRKWEYIYNPKINGNYVYKGKYNFYIPNSYISMERIL